VNGIATEASVAATPDGQGKVWVEPKTGLIVKWVMTPPKGLPRTMIEVTSFSLTPPSPGALALPPKCAHGA
jgi:outer membrane lipoprotein-sorting protein